MIWQFLLAWVAISILTLGAYALFVYLLKPKEIQDIVIGREPTPIAYEDNHEENLKAWMKSESFDPLANHGSVCLSCGDYIAPDEQPYCTRCFERLEREGFFEE